MVNFRSLLLAVVSGLVLSGMACADMMPEGQILESTVKSLERTRPSTPACQINDITDLGLGTEASFKDIISEAESDSDVQGVPCVIEETSSFNLCVYGLIGMGLLNCGPWIKRVSLGLIPEWYHDGGPQQIGYSYAVLPGSEFSFVTYCFVQPVVTVELRSLKFHKGAVASLVRKSHSTPTHLAGRGPPSLT